MFRLSFSVALRKTIATGFTNLQTASQVVVARLGAVVWMSLVIAGEGGQIKRDLLDPTDCQ